MNISKKNYKSLDVLDVKKNIMVNNNRLLVGWLKDTVSPDENVTMTHYDYINILMARERAKIAKNVSLISKPVWKLALDNYDRMVEVLKTDWIKDQMGAILFDGELYVYHTFTITDEMREKNREVDDIEQCAGCGVILQFDKNGLLVNGAFVSSRVDYAGDGKRKLMYDSPVENIEFCANTFTPILVMLAFMQYADTEVVYVENGQKKVCKTNNEVIQNTLGLPFRYIDSKWVREIVRTEGFKVSGHFRIQSTRNGKKLIYINEYQKHGYHRRAQKDLA